MPLSAAINSVLVWVVSLVLSLARWLLGASSRRLLGGAAWAVATVRRVLALLSPEGLAGSLSLAYASRVRALLELAAHEEEQGAPLQRRLRGLPPPVARYLQWALGEDGNGVQYM